MENAPCEIPAIRCVVLVSLSRKEPFGQEEEMNSQLISRDSSNKTIHNNKKMIESNKESRERRVMTEHCHVE